MSPLDVWRQLGSILSLDDLVIMGDGLVCRKRPPSTMEQLGAAVQAWRGHRGFRRLTEALPQIRPRTDSARETMLRLVVVRAGFPEPVVNHPIVNCHGAVIAHGDLAFPEYMTLLEYDGAQHREDEAQYTIDVARLDEIMEEGWRTIRVDKSLLFARAVLFGKIDRALRRGGWPGP